MGAPRIAFPSSSSCCFSNQFYIYTVFKMSSTTANSEVSPSVDLQPTGNIILTTKPAVTISPSGQVIVSEMPAFLGCCSDCFACHKACCAPSIAVGDIAEAVGKGGCKAICCYNCLNLCLLGDCCHGCTTSKQLRKQYGLNSN